MKAIICAAAGPLELYSPGTNSWAVCPCGQSAAKWEDPQAGKIIVAADVFLRHAVIGLGLVNTVLLNTFNHGGVWEDFREWHQEATQLEGYVFNEKRANCWAAPFFIETTSDSRWATTEEYKEVFG